MADVPRDTVSDTPVADTLSQTWDLSIGLSKQVAAARLGVVTKTLERRAPEWHIRSAPYRRPGGGAVIVVYHPGDVDQAVPYVKRTPVPGIPVDGRDLPTNGNGHRPAEALARTPDPELVDDARLVGTLRLFATALGRVSQTLSQTESQTGSTLEDDRWYPLEELTGRKGLTMRGLWKQIRKLGFVPMQDGGVRKLRGDQAKQL